MLIFRFQTAGEVHPMPGEGTVIWKKDDPRIRVIEFNNKQNYDLQFNKDFQMDNSTYTVKTCNKIISGIEIKFIKTMHNNEGDIQDVYFFAKNNKYYNLECWAFTGWNSQKQSNARKEVDKAVDTIVNTIQ